MILVVEGDRASDAGVVDLVDVDDVERATDVEEARDRLETSDPVTVLLTVSLDEAATLVEEVRSGRYGRPGLPIVVVADGDARRADSLGVDETVTTPVDGASLEAAVERAKLLGQYKEAVNDFFDACRRRAEGGPVRRGSHAARRTADAYLDEIQEREDPEAIESLFRSI